MQSKNYKAARRKNARRRQETVGGHWFYLMAAAFCTGAPGSTELVMGISGCFAQC